MKILMFNRFMEVLRPSATVDPRNAPLQKNGKSLEERIAEVRRQHADKLLIPDVEILNKVRRVG